MTEEVDKPCYLRRERRASVRFFINALCRVRHEDWPATYDAPKSSERSPRIQVMVKENMTLALNCWELVEKQRHQRVFHTRYVLKKKRDWNGQAQNSSSGLLICGSKEQHGDVTFSAVADFTVLKLILSSELLTRRHARNFEFQTAFGNETLDRPLYANPPHQVTNEAKFGGKVLQLHRFLYGRKYAASIWCNTNLIASVQLNEIKWKVHDASFTMPLYGMFIVLMIW